MSTTLARSAPEGCTNDLRASLTATRATEERRAERQRAFPDFVESRDNMVGDEQRGQVI